jgi:aryl-alcohol dehydrogenase-like predicted oxidoreductase
MGPRRTTELGSTGITVSCMGTGTNRWEKGENDEPVYQTFKALLESGIYFFDTAEVYTGGRSERLLGECLRRDGRSVVVASKYMPYPTRLTKGHFNEALDATRGRLGVATLDLYYVHMPPTLTSIESLMDHMAEAVSAGKIRAVGVSNFSAEQMRKAAAQLEKHNLTLAANEVEYSLTNREPEENGVLDTCKEIKASLVAYRPLSRGLLAANNARGNPIILKALEAVAERHGMKTSQIALAWLLQKDPIVIPIPGATKREHALENMSALDIVLKEDEFRELNEASKPR